MSRKVGITETVLRDAHQSLIATRMTTEDMLPIIDKMDHFDWSTEFYENEYSRIADVILGNI